MAAVDEADAEDCWDGWEVMPAFCEALRIACVAGGRGTVGRTERAEARGEERRTGGCRKRRRREEKARALDNDDNEDGRDRDGLLELEAQGEEQDAQEEEEEDNDNDDNGDDNGDDQENNSISRGTRQCRIVRQRISNCRQATAEHCSSAQAPAALLPADVLLVHANVLSRKQRALLEGVCKTLERVRLYTDARSFFLSDHAHWEAPPPVPTKLIAVPHECAESAEAVRNLNSWMAEQMAPKALSSSPQGTVGIRRQSRLLGGTPRRGGSLAQVLSVKQPRARNLGSSALATGFATASAPTAAEAKQPSDTPPPAPAASMWDCAALQSQRLVDNRVCWLSHDSLIQLISSVKNGQIDTDTTLSEHRLPTLQVQPKQGMLRFKPHVRPVAREGAGRSLAPELLARARERTNREDTEPCAHLEGLPISSITTSDNNSGGTNLAGGASFDSNEALLSALHELSTLKQLEDGQTAEGQRRREFHYKAYENAIRYIRRNWNKAIQTLEDVDELENRMCRWGFRVAPVGPGMLEKLRAYVRTGTLPDLAELRTQFGDVGDALITFKNIHGVGDAKAQELVEKGYRTIAELRAAVRRGEPVLNDTQRVGLDVYEDLLERMPREEAREIVARVERAVAELRTDGSISTLATGSYRRERPTCGDVDVLLCAKEGAREDGTILEELVDKLHHSGFITHVFTYLHKFDQKLAPIADSFGAAGSQGAVDSSMAMCVCRLSPHHKHRRLDLKYYLRSQYAFALLYFTGSGHFNRSMRYYVHREIFSTTPEGNVVNVSLSDKGFKHRINDEAIGDSLGGDWACSTEEEIFERIGLEYVEPPKREGGITWPRQQWRARTTEAPFTSTAALATAAVAAARIAGTRDEDNDDKHKT